MPGAKSAGRQNKVAELAAVVAAAAVFAWVTVDVVSGGPLRGWDRDVIGVAAPAGGPEPVGWRVLVDVGGAAFLCVVLLAAALTCLIRRRRVRPLVLAGGWIVAIEATIWLFQSSVTL